MSIRFISILTVCAIFWPGIACNSLPRHPISQTRNAESRSSGTGVVSPYEGTLMTFDQPVRIPGRILPPGSYRFTPEAGIALTEVRVQITNVDRSKTIANLKMRTVSQYQLGAVEADSDWKVGQLVVVMAEGRQGQPATLLNCYYVGKLSGLRFIYPSSVRLQLAGETHKVLVFNPSEARLARKEALGE